MNTVHPLWEMVRQPVGPLTSALRRAGLSAVGTYTAYVAYGLRHPDLLFPPIDPAERTTALPGDQLVSAPDWVTDFAVDIAADPSDVWPWLVQMGYGRGGYYSWFPLDNGGVPSAETILPALQDLKVGDLIPDGPRAAEGYGIWKVDSLDPCRALVLHSRRQPSNGREIEPGQATTVSFIDVSWAFVLIASAPGQTRLRVRVRAKSHGRWWIPTFMRAARLLFGFGDNVMESTMLAGIRDRSERRVRERAAAHAPS